MGRFHCAMLSECKQEKQQAQTCRCPLHNVYIRSVGIVWAIVFKCGVAHYACDGVHVTGNQMARLPLLSSSYFQDKWLEHVSDMVQYFL